MCSFQKTIVKSRSYFCERVSRQFPTASIREQQKSDKEQAKRKEQRQIMKIDQLPVEMLMKIFSYLPRHGELSQVNKHFYDLVCKVNDSKICIRIDRPFLERFICHNNVMSKWLPSIQSSKRQIRNVEIEGCVSSSFSADDLLLINSVVGTFSTSIKVLKWKNVSLEESVLMETLSLIPNIECLDVEEFPFSFNINDCRLRNSRRCIADLNLKDFPKLRSLTIRGDLGFFEVANRAAMGALTELNIWCYWDTLATLLNRQLNIKKLIFTVWPGFKVDTVDELAMDVFGKLKLESLEIHYDGATRCRDTLSKVLSKLTGLKSLVLAGRLTVVDDRAMNAITDHLDLTSLAINISDKPVESFVSIRKLKKLQELELVCDGHGPDSEAKLRILAGSGNIAMKKLTLNAEMSIDFIAAMAESAPHLTHINFITNNYDLNNAEKHAILRHFNFVEALKISTWYEPLASGYFNPKLRELEIWQYGKGHLNQQDLIALSVPYPNLRKLKISIKGLGTDVSLTIRSLLDSFTKLESLTLKTERLIVEDLNYLRHRKDNLKFVSLGGLSNKSLSNRLVKELRTNFDFVRADDNDYMCRRFLSMAVDKYTMDCGYEPETMPVIIDRDNNSKIIKL